MGCCGGAVLRGVGAFWLPAGRGVHRPAAESSRLLLVGVPDQVAPQVAPTAAERPRHAVLILLDGLRADHATQMTSVERLRQAGQCRTSDVGPLSVSRPVYAVVSTGLEQDRTGVRINDCSIPFPSSRSFRSRTVPGAGSLA